MKTIRSVSMFKKAMQESLTPSEKACKIFFQFVMKLKLNTTRYNPRLFA